MRKISWLDYSSIDMQHCLLEINEGLSRLGISQEDVISIQLQRSDRIEDENCRVSLFVFYWSN